MEKHPDPFDDFLKQALKGHQLTPPDKAKKAFLVEASAILPARKRWYSWYYIPILVILISGIVAFLNYQSRKVAAPSITASIENESNASVTDSSDSNLTSFSIQTSGNELNIIEPSAQIEMMTISESNSFYKTDLSYETPDKDPREVIVNPDTFDPVLTETTSSRLTLDSLSETGGSGVTEHSAEAHSPVPDTTFPMSGPENPETIKPDRASPASYFSAGVYYQPELMFNTLEDNIFVNNFGFDAIFYRGLISIRTGAGISVSKGITNNAIQYNGYLGTYNKLDSITFIFNESDHDFTPNLHMSSQKVWDSETKLDSSEVIKRYTYLQVPLILGFDFWQHGSFSVGVRVGTILSILLNEKQLSGDYNPGENLVVGIDGITPAHVSTNWQAIGGINASARLRKDIYFEIEPQAKYYYQSIYEKSGITKKPWSMGVRVAVLYKF